MLSSRAAVALALLSGEHSAMSPAPTSVTVAVCATPCAAISTAVVHDSTTAKVIEASSSSVVFLIPLPFHEGGETRQPRLKLYNATTLASGDELAMNFAPFSTLFLPNFSELR
jgi:hypothetical protein